MTDLVPADSVSKPFLSHSNLQVLQQPQHCHQLCSWAHPCPAPFVFHFQFGLEAVCWRKPKLSRKPCRSEESQQPKIQQIALGLSNPFGAPDQSTVRLNSDTESLEVGKKFATFPPHSVGPSTCSVTPATFILLKLVPILQNHHERDSVACTCLMLKPKGQENLQYPAHHLPP